MKLDAKIPDGSIDERWRAWLDDHRLVGPRQRHEYKVIVVGTGLAGAASFAVGWGVIGGQVVAHLEAGGSGGTAISIAPDVTYLLSEVGVVFIFGSGATLLGFALIALVIGCRGMLPAWLRWSTLLAGLCGVAGLAFFPFFLLLLWAAAIGVWLLTAAADLAA